MFGRRLLNWFFAVCVLGLLPGFLLAQSKDVAAIEDNSFMVEEAFNQEKNVIQHINLFTRTWNNKGWVYTFTDDWPFPGHDRHQMSATIPALQSSDYPDNGAGLGDIALNYRYQVAGG